MRVFGEFIEGMIIILLIIIFVKGCQSDNYCIHLKKDNVTHEYCVS